jgi:tetratricopeptide (TPR) repeat protein
MYERTNFLEAIRTVRSSSRILCAAFQRDLSALFDGELPEETARKTMVHMEACSDCSEFFEAIRLQALAHKDLAVPGSLAQRIRRLNGEDIFDGMTDSEILRRLASALYQLGKAYVLTATDENYRIRVAEEPVTIDTFECGEAVEAAHAAKKTGACATGAEALEHKAASHLAHGRQLLDEALSLKPKFAEAQLYLGLTCQAQKDAVGAEKAYQQVFLHTDRLVNRAHAAIQLGMLHDHAQNHARALRFYRWVVASGLVARREDFGFVLYNIAVQHLSLGNLEAAATLLVDIRQSRPTLWVQVRNWLRDSPELLGQLKTHATSRALFEADEPRYFAA